MGKHHEDLSLQSIPLFRARYNADINDEQRTQLILNEFEMVRKEVEEKTEETECRSNSYRIINTVSSLLIILCSCVIVSLQAVSECINVPVIVLSGIIFVTEGAHKLFRWGPQGVLYKHGTIQLRRISRQIREYMYFFHRYSGEQLLALISMLRAQYDDIDASLYKMAVSGSARYQTGMDIEQGGGNNTSVPSALDITRPAALPSVAVLSQLNNSNPSTPAHSDTPSHVHIHIERSPAPSTPTLTVPVRNTPNLNLPHSTPTRTHGRSFDLTSSNQPSVQTPRSRLKQNSLPKSLYGNRNPSDLTRTPSTPIRTPKSPIKTSAVVRSQVPTIEIDSEETRIPISINEGKEDE